MTRDEAIRKAIVGWHDGEAAWIDDRIIGSGNDQAHEKLIDEILEVCDVLGLDFREVLGDE